MARGYLTTSEGVDSYRIDGVDEIAPFLMTVVSDTDLWMFVSSTGALTTGRIDADHALFPYATDDRIHRSAGLTGPVTTIARTIAGIREVWRPFGPLSTPGCRRSVTKSTLGDRLVFEEHHAEWELEFRSTWEPSDVFGWVRTVELVNHGRADTDVEVLDGFVDVMPAAVDALTEQIRSNLVDAYKRSELAPTGRVAIFSLEALITDRAEPAESLTATVVWSEGFDEATLSLDPSVAADMLAGRESVAAGLVTGSAGAYLLRGRMTVGAGARRSWIIVADTPLSHAAVVSTVTTAASPSVRRDVSEDVRRGSARLRALVHDADGVQSTADPVADAHHLSNVLFNSMRGGTFPHGHRVPVADFAEFVRRRNRPTAIRHGAWLDSLGPEIDVAELRDAAILSSEADLIRLTLEYLPLTFSRRHGDPSRPWNRFSIRVRSDDGSELLTYEGNWRDIFQNWEALLHSFPAYLLHVVAKFVNASTIEGYNPYRISRDGIDWEVPDPDDPWSHIGYWGDHQIVYLLRLLEAWNAFEPDAILDWLDRRVFVYADVPYRLADHDAMVSDPRNTIEFDEHHADAIERREALIGTDGRLLVDAEQTILSVGLLEKLLVPALAKVSSLIPDGGIWLNTQRPEWNDANNALAGPGLSIVTLFHLRRYLRFLGDLLERSDAPTVPISGSVATWTATTLEIATDALATPSLDERQRRSVVDALGRSASDHRARVRSTIDVTRVDVASVDLARWCSAFGELLDRSIGRARRDDGLYHAYNRVSFPDDERVEIDHLGEMLEGQVAALSSGVLDAVESLALIDALYASGMYRPDLDTFMLYPAIELAGFLDRNRVPESALARRPELREWSADPPPQLFDRDEAGHLRFRPDLVNAAALRSALLSSDFSADQRTAIEELYEDVFDHRSFTGRSGSMYAYEGIGSVYWHMVSKLLLAVQETYWTAVDTGIDDEVVGRLRRAYQRVRGGLGFLKDPDTFGAIPTDCYSHSPAHRGAQQPGMTGQVKEEVLTRLGELGLRVVGGRLVLRPGLLPLDEIIPTDGGREARFTFCATPITIVAGSSDAVTVVGTNGSRSSSTGSTLTRADSNAIFARSGLIASVEFTVAE